MTDVRHCATCWRPLDANGFLGLCQACLIEMALGQSGAAGNVAPAADVTITLVADPTRRGMQVVVRW